MLNESKCLCLMTNDSLVQYTWHLYYKRTSPLAGQGYSCDVKSRDRLLLQPLLLAIISKKLGLFLTFLSQTTIASLPPPHWLLGSDNIPVTCFSQRLQAPVDSYQPPFSRKLVRKLGSFCQLLFLVDAVDASLMPLGTKAPTKSGTSVVWGV